MVFKIHFSNPFRTPSRSDPLPIAVIYRLLIISIVKYQRCFVETAILDLFLIWAT